VENRPKRKEKLFGLDSNPLTDKPISNTWDRFAEGADGPRTGAVQLLENVKIAMSHTNVCQEAVNSPSSSCALSCAMINIGQNLRRKFENEIKFKNNVIK
jgi:hypothetical protein